jgi:hypothetical protein
LVTELERVLGRERMLSSPEDLLCYSYDASPTPSNRPQAVVDDPGKVTEEVLWEAAESCPMDAVILEDDEGGQLHP